MENHNEINLTKEQVAVFVSSMKWVRETPYPNDNQEENLIDYECFYDIFTTNIWNLSDKIMLHGNQNIKNMMSEYAAECDKEWDGQSWVDVELD
jgi:hypothetical protein